MLVVVRSLAFVCLVAAVGRSSAQRSQRTAEPTPVSETFAVDVRVQAVDTFSLDPAPGIRVELGISAKRDSERDATPPFHLGEPVLARAASDERGWIEARVPLPLEWKERAGPIWVRVESQGCARSVAYVERKGTSATESERLLISRGGTLLGSARSADGAPLAGARAWLEHEGNGKLACTSETTTRGDGTFALYFSSAGRYHVHVRSPLHGSSTDVSFELDPERRAEPVTVAVGGGVDVRGRVVDPDLVGVPGAWLSAVPAGRTTFPSFEECFAAEHAGELFGTRAWTDADGSFVLPRLLPGRYTLYARLEGSGTREDGMGEKAEQLGTRLDTLDLRAGNEPVSLLYRAHRLEVRVLDEIGAAAEPFTRNARGEREGSRLELRPLEDGRFTNLNVLWPSQAGERLVFGVEPEREYLASWTDDAVPLVEERVTIPRAPYRVPLELRLGPRGAPATLDVRVLDPDGNPFDDAQISVFSAASGRTVCASREQGTPGFECANDGAWSVELPPGRYRVVASVEPFLGCLIPDTLPRTPHTPAEILVETRAGEHTLVELRLGAAGHLDFESVSGTGPSAKDLALLRGREAEMRPDDARARLDGGRVVLVSGERRIALERLGIDGVTLGELDWIAPGWSARGLDPIPVGDWTLRVEGDSGTLLERTVRIEAGAVTVVHW